MVLMPLTEAPDTLRSDTRFISADNLPENPFQIDMKCHWVNISTYVGSQKITWDTLTVIAYTQDYFHALPINLSDLYH